MTVGKSLKGCKGVGAAGWWGFIGYNYRPGPKPWEAGYHLLPTPNGYQTRSKDTPCSKVVVMVGMVGSVVLVVLVVGYDGFDTIIACQVPGMEIKRKLRKPRYADFIFHKGSPQLKR